MTAPESHERILRLDGLSIEVARGVETLQLVDAVSLSIGRGEICCLVGESGSGKSLTARAIMGLCPPQCRVRAQQLSIDSTTVRITRAGHEPTLAGDRVSMVFQNPMTSLNPLLALETQLTEAYVALGKGNRSDARRKALAMLEEVGIDAPTQRLRQYPHQLSGGQRQRVLIAMALMCNPALLIADEPTTALDAATQLQILELLRKLKTAQGLGILFITHDLAVVAHIADQVAVMYAGQLVEIGTVREVIETPAHPYTRALLECTPQLPTESSSVLPQPIPGTARTRRKDEPGCVFAERCSLAAPACRTETVAMTRRSATHVARCLFA